MPVNLVLREVCSVASRFGGEESGLITLSATGCSPNSDREVSGGLTSKGQAYRFFPEKGWCIMGTVGQQAHEMKGVLYGVRVARKQKCEWQKFGPWLGII